MTFLATYYLRCHEDAGYSGTRHVCADTLEELYVQIAKTKFKIEYGTDDPDDWYGNKRDDSTSNWVIFQQTPSDQPFNAREISTFKDMVARAEVGIIERMAADKAETAARQEVEERATLKALLEKYGNEG